MLSVNLKSLIAKCIRLSIILRHDSALFCTNRPTFQLWKCLRLCVVVVQPKRQYGNAHRSNQQDRLGGLVSRCDDQSVLGWSTTHLLVRHENTDAAWYLRPQPVQPPSDALQKRVQQTQRTFSRYTHQFSEGAPASPLVQNWHCLEVHIS